MENSLGDLELVVHALLPTLGVFLKVDAELYHINFKLQLSLHLRTL